MESIQARLLIYGTGVIGSLYAALFSRSGFDVSVYARGHRLEALKEHGLRYQHDGVIEAADVHVLDHVARDDVYDFIFVTVRCNQLHRVLSELRENASPTIVTMVNSLDDYRVWDDLCGEGRVLPAFPGAGGGFADDLLQATLTPRFVQPTTFGEVDGKKTERLSMLADVFDRSRIPYQIVPDMHAWQVCHLAMVVPIADAYYESDRPSQAGRERGLMHLTAQRIQSNLRRAKELGIKLSPGKMHLLATLPEPVLALCLGRVFQSNFGDVFMYRHSMKAPDEMRMLHDMLYAYLGVSAGSTD